MDFVNLTHHFLIAMPNMVDPNFARSLTYICEHNDRARWVSWLTAPPT
jgi:putative transcriptional regulator